MGPTLRSKPVIWATYAYDDAWDGAEHVRERGLVVALRASKGAASVTRRKESAVG